MKDSEAIMIENLLRTLAGCERYDYGIDHDLIKPNLAQWFADHYDQFPDSITKNAIVTKWTPTFLGIASEKEELSEDQVQSFLDDLRQNKVNH